MNHHDAVGGEQQVCWPESVTVESVITRLVKTNAVPSDPEIELVLRDGTLVQVGIALVHTGCLDQRLKRRYSKLRREEERRMVTGRSA